MPESQQIDVKDLFAIIGEQTVQLYVERTRLAKATEIITLQQEKLAAFEPETKKD